MTGSENVDRMIREKIAEINNDIERLRAKRIVVEESLEQQTEQVERIRELADESDIDSYVEIPPECDDLVQSSHAIDESLNELEEFAEVVEQRQKKLKVTIKMRSLGGLSDEETIEELRDI